MQSVRDEDAGLSSRGIEKDVLEDGGTNMGIECGEGIIEDEDIAIGIDGTTDIDPLLLATRE